MSRISEIRRGAARTDVIVVDFSYGGHHPLFISIVLKAVTCPVLVSRELWNQIGEADQLSVKTSVYIADAVADIPELHVRTIDDFCRQNPTVTRVFHMCLDRVFRFYAMRAILAGRSVGISGLWLNSDFRYRLGVRSRLKYLINLFAFSASALRVRNTQYLFMDENLANDLRRIPGLKQRVGWCPEPWREPSGEDASIKSIARGSVLMIGAHSARKGTDWALRAIKSGWPDELPLKLCIAGPDLTNSIAEIANDMPANITIQTALRQLTSDEVSQYIDSCDIVLLPYISFGGSSNIQIQGAAYGKKILVSDYGVSRDRVERLNMGTVFRHKDPLDLVAKLRQLVFSSSGQSSTQYVGAFRDSAFADAIAGCLDCAPPSSRIQ